MSFLSGSTVTAGDSAGTNLVIARPAGALPDHILWLRLYVEDITLTPSISPGTWTKDTNASGEQLAEPTDWESHVYWSRQGAESGNITVSWGGASVFRVGMGAAYDNRITTGDPLDATSTFNASGSATTTATALSVTTAHANADLIAGSGAVAAASGAYAWASLTERAEIGLQSFADGVQAGIGASGNKTATVDSSFWAAGLTALRENVAIVVDSNSPARVRTHVPVQQRVFD